ncbi:unnamed protein product [Darwinula stevensoni]|uniref:DML1/Misato tubulin domain-containing protein n=1 Tax=Darwinula stevensoni TaxID=69355 RepID=A0A7R8ZY89_9CRUS|nr:unnamed protein product [Darwinula stevensoni]CAG0881090.1 unnamed protein product [Darwinula stevensoni]
MKKSLRKHLVARNFTGPFGEITFTPRLVSVDLNGSARSLPCRAPAVDDDHERWTSTIWTGKTEKHLATTGFPCTRWSEYLRVELHPRSLHPIPSHAHDDGEHPLGAFPLAREIWSRGESPWKTDIVDAIRAYGEECDNLQGFVVLVDADDGFGGIGSHLLEHLDEEYPRKGCLAIPNAELPGEDAPGLLLSLNRLLSLHSVLSSDAAACIPLSLATSWAPRASARVFPSLVYDGRKRYEAAGILATCLESLTTPFRSRRDKLMDLRRLADGVCIGSLRLAAPRLSFPTRGDDVQSAIGDSVPLLPSAKEKPLAPPWACHVVARGGLRRPPPRSDASPSSSPRSSESGAEERRERLLASARNVYPGCRVVATRTEEMITVKAPYPRDILRGFPDGSKCPEELPCLSLLENGADCGASLREAIGCVEGIRLASLPLFASSGLEQDGFGEAVEALRTLVDGYSQRDS